MNPARERRYTRLRTLEGLLNGALAYALAAGDRRWYRVLASRHARVDRAITRSL